MLGFRVQGSGFKMLGFRVYLIHRLCDSVLVVHSLGVVCGARQHPGPNKWYICVTVHDFAKHAA